MNDPHVNQGPAHAGWQLHKVPAAMKRLSLSRTVLYEQLRSGRLRSVWQGRTRLIPEDAIGEYITLLETEAQQKRAH